MWRQLSYFPRALKVRWTFAQRGPKWNGEWSTPEKEDAIIQAVNAQESPIVYMLWGRPAQSKIPMLTNPKHLILKAPHPSPLSAYRGFFGCRHFSQANAFLEKNGVQPIDWQIEDV